MYPAGEFKPWPKRMAQEAARLAAKAWEESQGGRASGHRCKVCIHPDRVELDTRALTGESLKGIGRLVSSKYTAAQVRCHRDLHLLPLIRREVKIGPMTALSAPYPMDGDVDERSSWHLMQYHAIRELAINEGDYGNAVRCQKEMREVEIWRAKNMPLKNARPVAAHATQYPALEMLAPQNVLDEDVLNSPELEARLNRALIASRSGETDNSKDIVIGPEEENKNGQSGN